MHLPAFVFGEHYPLSSCSIFPLAHFEVKIILVNQMLPWQPSFDRHVDQNVCIFHMKIAVLVLLSILWHCLMKFDFQSSSISVLQKMAPTTRSPAKYRF